MKLKILSPEKELYKSTVKGFNITTLSGEITILDNHGSLISMFNDGIAHIIDNQDKRRQIELRAGFLEMTPENELNVLTE